MRIECNAELGFAINNSIVRMEHGLETYWNDNRYKGEALTYAISADGKLSVEISLKDRAIVGLSYRGDISALPRCNYKKAYTADGKVTVQVCKVAGCNTVFLPSGCAAFDSANGVITFGDCQNECLVVRVCDNMFVYLDQNNLLSGVAVII